MIRWVVTISIVVVLTGCGTKPVKTPLPNNGPTMREILEREGHLVLPPVPTRPPLNGTYGLSGYTRDAFNELNVRFPRLPNPILIMYVFPHLSKEGTPIPGYSTMFPMYESVEYALPRELP